MKKYFTIMLLMWPLLLMAQGQKGDVEGCAPMKEGKVVYTDEVEIQGASQSEIFTAIHNWAKKAYGKDIFLSNLTANKAKGTIMISSKIELLLNDTDSTQVKFKMYINCLENKYTVEAKDIKYLYEPAPVKPKKYKTYAAENVIANNGKSNTIEIIKDPELFCNATFFFFENLFADVYEAAKEAEN